MTKETVATLSPETYDEIGDLVTEEASSETLRENGETLLAWRESFWATHPVCAEVFNIGLAMDETAADLAVFIAYQLAGVSADDNPYFENLQMGIGLLSALLSELLRHTTPTRRNAKHLTSRASAGFGLARLRREFNT